MARRASGRTAWTFRWSMRWRPASTSVHPELNQAVTLSRRRLHRHAGPQPALHPQASAWSKPYSPLFKYEWEPTYESLRRYATRHRRQSPYDGILMNYVNPLTGGPVMHTIGASMQMLRPGEQTKAHRHTGSFLYQVAKGSGYSIIDGQRLDWTRTRHLLRAVLGVPRACQRLSQTDDACLFCFHDLPVMQRARAVSRSKRSPKTAATSLSQSVRAQEPTHATRDVSRRHRALQPDSARWSAITSLT